MRRGFTLVELLVVTAMIMILAASVTSATMNAQRRARIAKATTTCREMTNAILAYENYAEGYVFEENRVTGDSWRDADSSFLGFILGQENMHNGGSGKVPVLFNAEIKNNGMILDPWNHPYKVRIAKSAASTLNQNNSKASALYTSVMFPNFHRRLAAERD